MTAPAAPAAPAAPSRDDAEAVLRALAGPTAVLREDQWTAIEALVAHRRRALVVQRTGWGKSAVYFVATALLRGRGGGEEGGDGDQGGTSHRGILGRLTVATACAAMPSPRPVKPSRSVVVAFTLTRSGLKRRMAAIRSTMTRPTCSSTVPSA